MSGQAGFEERFPPLITPVPVSGGQDVHEHALAHAAEDGAGTCYVSMRADFLSFAVVLEPEEPLKAARRVLFCGMNALAETIAADAPPEVSVRFAYPSSIIFDEGLVGGMRLAWPAECGDDAVPGWMTLSATLHAKTGAEGDFSLDPGLTTLEEAGLPCVDGQALAARFCRHLLVEIDEWQNVGFAGVGERYLQRIPRQDTDGVRRIEPKGDLVVHDSASGGRRILSLVDGLAEPFWLNRLRAGAGL